jgi:hypothetical protein
LANLKIKHQIHPKKKYVPKIIVVFLLIQLFKGEKSLFGIDLMN